MYPSLEDMKVDQMMQAQARVSASAPIPASLPYQVNPAGPSPNPIPTPSYPTLTNDNTPATSRQSQAYPGLAEYMGMELSEAIIRENMPEYLNNQSVVAASDRSVSSTNGSTLVAPISGHSPGLVRAQVSHGVRQIVLCKDRDNKIGLKVKSVNKGVFV